MKAGREGADGRRPKCLGRLDTSASAGRIRQ